MSNRPVKLPPLSAIRAFEAAARSLSFTRAADELGMTQAAVSYQIRQLEQRVGLPLFTRSTRRVALTPAGQKLSEVTIGAFDAIRGAFARVARRAESELAITSLPTIAANWLAPRLGQFHLAHPDIAVRLDTTVAPVDLTQGGFDVALRSGQGHWDGVDADLLFQSLYTPLCTPAVAAGLGSPEQILNLPVFGHIDRWIQWLSELGVTCDSLLARPSVDLGVEQFDVKAAVSANGLAITHPLFFQNELKLGQLVQPFRHVSHGRHGFWLAYATPLGKTRKVQAFRRWILDQARESGY